MTIAVIWPISGGISRLGLTAGATISQPYASNSNGSVIVGYCSDGATQVPVRWDGTAVTQLAAITTADAALYLSRDAQILLGLNSVSTIAYARWTSGGTAGANLTIPAGYTASVPLSGLPTRWCSDDGTMIIGTSTGGSGPDSPVLATQWTNGTPTTLLPSTGGTNTTEAADQSEDGSVVIGNEQVGAFVPVGCFWVSGVPHRLVNLSGSDTTLFHTQFCDGAGETIYGVVEDSGGDAQLAYWDTLSANFGGLYGVIHQMDRIGATGVNAPTLTGVAETGNIAVGWGYPASGPFAAIKWHLTTATSLPDLAGGGAVANACSGDGDIVVGYSFDIHGNQVPCYWDASNVIHALPLLPDAPIFGIALGVSRDGTLAWGIVDPPVTPPPPSSGPMSSIIGKRTGP